MARGLAHFAPGPVHLQAAIWKMDSGSSSRDHAGLHAVIPTVIRGGRGTVHRLDDGEISDAAYIGCGM